MLKKVRFIEPGNHTPYRDSAANRFVYNKTIRNPSTGLITLATLAKELVPDTLMYSESISEIRWDDVFDSDIVFFSLNTFNAMRGYALAKQLRVHSSALIVFGGMHASLHYTEAVQHCDYVLLGDGDESLPQFIRAVAAGGPIDFPGVAYLNNGQLVHTGRRTPPENIDTIPDRNLVYRYAQQAKKYDTLWPQVHASRGCPHHCGYCGVVRHFGNRIRTRSPGAVVEDIRRAVAFHKRTFPPRLNTCVWITDDNFAADRPWALAVLKAIIASGIKCHFSIQARYETGFDDEMLELMKQAGFMELALGIEFLHDDSFVHYGKKSTYREIVASIANIKRHGIGVRGLFIVGADADKKGVGHKIAAFVKENGIHGALVQSMFFVPGTPAYDESRHLLLHENWEKYCGNVVHRPKSISPADLQLEIIAASREIYSRKNLLRALFTYRWINKVLFLGEYLWQKSMRDELRRELPYLKSVEHPASPIEESETALSA